LPARPQAGRRPRRTSMYVEAFEREGRQVCEPEGRERSWRAFSTVPKRASSRRRESPHKILHLRHMRDIKVGKENNSRMHFQYLGQR
jgi:hypothetical protein